MGFQEKTIGVVDLARISCAAPFWIDPDELPSNYSNKAVYLPPPPTSKRTRKHTPFLIIRSAS